MKKTPTQNEMILSYMEEGHEVTPLDALNLFGCFRLSARIFDLRAHGHNIKARTVTRDGKSYAAYSIAK